MELTFEGMVIEVKPLQPEKAEEPISVTFLGIVKEVKPLQPERAVYPIDTIFSPKSKERRF